MYMSPCWPSFVLFLTSFCHFVWYWGKDSVTKTYSFIIILKSRPTIKSQKVKKDGTKEKLGWPEIGGKSWDWYHRSQWAGVSKQCKWLTVSNAEHRPSWNKDWAVNTGVRDQGVKCQTPIPKEIILWSWHSKQQIRYFRIWANEIY